MSTRVPSDPRSRGRRGPRVFVFIVLAAVLVPLLAWFLVLRRSPGQPGLPADVRAEMGDEAMAGAGAVKGPIDVRRQPVVIYQRASTQELTLEGVSAEIVWLDAPVDRARQVVQLVLEGVPGSTSESVPPAPAGVRFRDVRLANSGVAWIDLEGVTLGGLGSDHELALVATIARSLTEAFPDEIRAVGFLVDGEPRPSLGGHSDLTHTYTGHEWPLRHP